MPLRAQRYTGNCYALAIPNPNTNKSIKLVVVQCHVKPVIIFDKHSIRRTLF